MFNTLKTITLLALLSGVCIAIGSLFGTEGIQIACIMALFMNGIMYFWSDTIVLNMYRAEPLDRTTYAHLYELIAALATQMAIPMPKVWLVRSAEANAFATGRNPSHASVALTQGIIDLLDEDELRGVLAHELAHVKNRDILIGTIAATLASIISSLSYSLRYMPLWSSGDKKRESGNSLALMLAGLVLPLVATLLQLGISRSREYQADQTGASTTHDALALASALRKLSIYTQTTAKTHQYRPADALCIVNPLCGIKIMQLLSTHPPIESRIKRLEELHRKLF